MKKRSCFLLNERVLIDFGPDLPAACQDHDVQLSKLEHIFITHTHSDHLQINNLWLIQASRKTLDKPIVMHMSYEAFTYCKKVISRQAARDGYQAVFTPDNRGLVTFRNGNEVRIHVIEPYTSTEVDDMQIFAVQSNHRTSVPNEYTLNYLISTSGGTRLLYASDTGLYSKMNLEALSGAALDVLIMEATFGSRPLEEDDTHLNGDHFIRMVEMMSEHGIVNEKTRIFSTHLSQMSDFMHDDLQAYFDRNSRFQIVVAYDGLAID